MMTLNYTTQMVNGHYSSAHDAMDVEKLRS